MAKVKVLLFGWVEREIGEELVVDAESVDDVKQALVKAGLTEDDLKALLVVPRKGGKESSLSEGDEVLVFPIVGGG